MPKLKDPQGHTIEVTQKQLDSGNPIPCPDCGWLCSVTDVLPPSAVPVPNTPGELPEPSPEPPDDEPQSESAELEEDEDDEACP